MDTLITDMASKNRMEVQGAQEALELVVEAALVWHPSPI
jgi:hypothetical protein